MRSRAPRPPARGGADVAITFRTREADARRVVSGIEAMGRRGVAIRADLTRPADCRRAVSTSARTLGRLDILVNNVGGGTQASVDGVDLRGWGGGLELDLTGAF